MTSNRNLAAHNVAEASPSDDVEVNATVPKYVWHRGVFFNATIVGISAFAAPGLWNAMNSVGAGGQQTPYLVMAGNAILFAVMVFTCLTGSMMANRFGLRNSLVVGTTGYVIYSAALYTNNRYGTEWFIYLGSAACGLSAGVFWATEGAIMLSYPEPEKRECLGPACSFLLTPPEKVVRRNGTRVQPAERIPDFEELKALVRVLLRKDFLLVLPFFIYVAWELPYISAYLSLYFSVRSRALASLVSAVAQVVTTLVFGAFLDWTRLSLNKRAKFGYVAMMSLIGGCWIWGTVIQNEYTHHKPSLDWDDGEFGKGWALYIFWQINFSLTYNFGFWLISFLAREPKETIRYMSVARAAEAAGQCISSGISSTSAPLISALGVNFALWGIALIPAYFVVSQVGVIHFGPERLASPLEEEEEEDKKGSEPS